MNKTELTSLLEKLRTELESGPSVDEPLRQSLAALDADIQRVLGQAAPGAGDGSLNARAQELEARFTLEHPYLASTLRDVMDILGKMGI
jgi:hypothetical protein